MSHYARGEKHHKPIVMIFLSRGLLRAKQQHPSSSEYSASFIEGNSSSQIVQTVRFLQLLHLFKGNFLGDINIFF